MIRNGNDGETDESTNHRHHRGALDGFAIMCSLSSQTLGPLFSNRPRAAKSNANCQHEQKRQLSNEPNKYFVFNK
jgi:hypothetical protein